MAQSARNVRISRRSWLLASLGIPLFGARAEESLAVTFDGDNLHVAAPGLHFLTGRPLDRLKDGLTVAYLSKLTLFSDSRGTVFRAPAPERIIVSYDLWQENFAVTLRGAAVRSSPRLSAPQAETWCFDNLAISTLGLPPDRPFWLRWELRTADPRDLGALLGDTGISLGRLIEMIGRKAGADDLRWERNAGPFRLQDLPRIPAIRGRIG